VFDVSGEFIVMNQNSLKCFKNYFSGEFIRIMVPRCSCELGTQIMIKIPSMVRK